MKKKENKILISIICILVVLAIVLFAIVVVETVKLNKNKNSQVKNSKEITTLESVQQKKETKSQNATVDLSCIKKGIYTEGGVSSDNIYSEGGCMLKVISISDNKISFEYTTIQSAPSNRVASIQINDVTFDDKGRAEFKFDEDGWGNRGTGRLYINKNKTLQVDISITGQNSEAMWNIGGCNQLSYIGK